MVRFNKPPPAVLVKRLKAVCAEEGLTADSRSLNKLAEVTGCDIRSCLNTLQVRRPVPVSRSRLQASRALTPTPDAPPAPLPSSSSRAAPS